MVVRIFQSGLLVLSFFFQLVSCVSPLVNLTYSQYIGQPLVNGITQWLGIRYAAPPVGNLRFEPPRDPPYVSGPQVASDHGKTCLGTGDSPNNTATSEDCLFLDVYAPSNATSKSYLPVFVFIQGGGYNTNAEPNLNGTGLIMASGNNIIVITFNYRVGPYGFLTDGGNGYIKANNGLLDQRKVLDWVQKNIYRFGGDPGHVVLGGASAGAGSISLHMVAYGGKDYGLFHAAAASSVSFGTLLTADDSAYQYENFAIRLGCASASTNQTISCLRSKSSYELQTQNFNIPFPGAASPPLFMWGPVIDNDMLTDLTYNAFENGKFIRIPMIIGDDTNGGTIFAPSTTSSQAQSNQFIKNQFPYITLPQLAKLNQLYPNPNNPPPYLDQQPPENNLPPYPYPSKHTHHHSHTHPYVPPPPPNNSTWWRQLSNVYGELRYMCPGLYLNTALRRYGVPSSFAYRWNVEDKAQMDAGYGVPHTAEVAAIFGPYNILPKKKQTYQQQQQGWDGQVAMLGVPGSYLPNETNSHAVVVVQGYWASFVRWFDPNVGRCCGSAEWVRWETEGDGGGGGERMLFGNGGRTGMERVDDGLRGRCEYLSGLGRGLRQ